MQIEKPNNEEEENLKTIQNCIKIYEKTSLLLNPIHYHAFTKLSFPFNITTKKCIGCNKSLSLFRNPLFSFSGVAESDDEGGPLVKCLVCGIIVHRSCSFNKDIGICSVYLDNIKKEKQLLQEEEERMRLHNDKEIVMEEEIRSKVDNDSSNEFSSIDKDENDIVDTKIITISSTEMREEEEEEAAIVDDNNDNNEYPVKNDNNNGSNDDDQENIINDNENDVIYNDNNNTTLSITTTTDDNNNISAKNIESSKKVENKVEEGRIKNENINENNTPSTNVILSSPPSNMFNSIQKQKVEDINNNNNPKEPLIWSEEGPPSHWAINEPTKLNGIQVGALYEDTNATTETVEEGNTKLNEKIQFVVLSNILHENLVSYFQRLMTLTNKDRKDDDDDDDDDDDAEQNNNNDMINDDIKDKVDDNDDETASSSTQEEEKELDNDVTVSASINTTKEDTTTNATASSSIEGNNEIQTSPMDLTAFLESSSQQQSSSNQNKISFLNGTKQTIEATKKLSSLAPKLTIASIAGGLAGSVVGFALCTSAPVACIMAPFVGRYCSVVGVLLLEGSVIVSGFHAGYQTIQNTVNEDNMSKYRVLTLFHNNNKNDDSDYSKSNENDAVVLLRPNVLIDPEWNTRANEILQTTTTAISPSNNILQQSQQQNNIYQEQKNKQIIYTNENEISNENKIFLLISRLITDKYNSNVGKVYHGLIDFYYKRITIRDLHNDLTVDKEDYLNDGNNNLNSKLSSSSQEEEDNDAIIHRERRIDAHAVIHYTIKTLFEDKPKLLNNNNISSSSSSSLNNTDNNKLVSTLSINSIEEIVLNELYISLYEEIRFEMYEKDNLLSSNIYLFLKQDMLYNDNDNNRHSSSVGDDDIYYPDSISKQALNCIKSLPDVRSAIKKLKYCIEFIEYISLSYTKKQHNNSTPTTTATTSSSSTATLMCADSLLTLVCQHIIYAQIPYINAEIAFIEEYIRDEYLLKGIEGYVLVTLQASLSFLNGCDSSLKDFKELFI